MEPDRRPSRRRRRVLWLLPVAVLGSLGLLALSQAPAIRRGWRLWTIGAHLDRGAPVAEAERATLEAALDALWPEAAHPSGCAVIEEHDVQVIELRAGPDPRWVIAALRVVEGIRPTFVVDLRVVEPDRPSGAAAAAGSRRLFLGSARGPRPVDAVGPAVVGGRRLVAIRPSQGFSGRMLLGLTEDDVLLTVRVEDAEGRLFRDGAYDELPLEPSDPAIMRALRGGDWARQLAALRNLALFASDEVTEEPARRALLEALSGGDEPLVAEAARFVLSSDR